MHKLVYWILIFAGMASLAGAGCSAKSKASRHLNRADRFFGSGHYQEAEIEYENVLRNDPKNSKAWDRLGEIYFNEGRGPEALPILLEARELDPANRGVHLELGTLYLELGQPRQAQGEADWLLSGNMLDQQAPLLLARSASTNDLGAVASRLQSLQQKGNRASLEAALGILALRQINFKTAAEHFNQAIALDPGFSDAYSGLGTVLFAQKDLKRADHDLQIASGLAPVWSGNGIRYAEFKAITGDTAGAQQMLLNIVAKTPFYLPAWMGLAQLAASQNDYSNALSQVENVLARDPRNFAALLFRGRLELLQNQPDQAIHDYQQMAGVYPDAPSVYYALAQAYLANSETNEANSSLTHALKIKPDYADAIMLRAQSQIARGDPASAIVNLEQLIRQQPHLLQAWLSLADAYRAQGAPDSAVDIYRQLESSYPNDVQIPVLLGVLLFQQNQHDAARAEFQKALRFQPDYLPAIGQLVELDLAEKQFSAALQRVQQLIVRNPDRAMPQLLLGTTLAASGETNQAVSALIKAIKLQPDTQGAYLLLAQLYSDTGQNQKALNELRLALERDPNNVTAVMLEGLIYDGEGDYEDAIDAYQKALAAVPDNGLVLNNLACIYADHFNQLDKAYPLARRANEIAPSDPSVADTLGWILYRKGEYTSALVLLRQSANKLYSVPEIQFHLGMACYFGGFESEAKTALQRALTLNGSFPEKNECRQRLAILDIDPGKGGTDTQVWLEKWTTDHPNDVVALSRLAAIYQSKKLIDNAVSADQAILDTNPQNVFALANLAQIYSSIDQQKACAFAKSAYDASPGDPDIAYLYGRLSFKIGDYSRALTLLQVAAQAKPQNADVLFDLGQAFYSEGKISDAQLFAQRAIHSDPDFNRADDARRFLELTDLANNVPRASVSQINHILTDSPAYVPALMVKGAICAQKSDIAAACETYRQVLNIYPDFAPAKRDLAVLYAADPVTDPEAYPIAVQAHLAFPNDPYVAKALGMIVCRQGDYGRAAGLLEEGAHQLNGDPQLLFYLGLAQFHLKDNSGSKANLERALALNLSGKDAASARQMLAELK